MSGKAHNEHITSGFPATADIPRTCGNGRKVPIADIAPLHAVSELVYHCRAAREVCRRSIKRRRQQLRGELSANQGTGGAAMLFCITANYTPKALEAMGKNPKTN